MKNIRAIRTEADYDWALAEIERYFLKEPEPGTPAAERFDVLAALIEPMRRSIGPLSRRILSKPSATKWKLPA